MTSEELDLVETDDLIAALKRRSSAGIFAYVLNEDDHDTSANLTYCPHGGTFAALGICLQVQHLMLTSGEDVSD